jgi:glycosyltransferase involved in cell wall biosynthesis
MGPIPRLPVGNRPLHVVIVGEGTYPYHAGGVSTWCHQLVQGMPENSWTAVALSVDGTERSSWDAPANLAQVVNIPLWGTPPPAKGRDRKPGASFASIHYAFLRALIRPKTAMAADPSGAIGDFLAALRDMFFYAQSHDLRAALITNAALERLLEVWREAGMDAEAGELTLKHALTATDSLEHVLRPLSHPPIRSDVCHLSMNGISALVAMTCKWAFGTPVVMSEHGVYLREQYLSKVRENEPYPVKVIMLRFFRALAGAAYRMSDLLTPHSQYNRRWQLKNGADPGRVRTMYNGINPEDFPAAEGEPDVPTIVFVGRIDPLKDLHTLIRSFAVVRTAVPNARLRIFGPVPPENAEYHKSCVALVDELGLTGVAVFEGRVPRQLDAYTAGHVVALTSISEGFPYTVVESMSVGRPPVCTNVGGVSEAVGDAGFVVPPRNHHAVAQACVQLLTNPELRRRLGGLARQRVLERFTLDQWNDAYRAIYHELVGRRAQPMSARSPLPVPIPDATCNEGPRQAPVRTGRPAPTPARLPVRYRLPTSSPSPTNRTPRWRPPAPNPRPAATQRPTPSPGSALAPNPTPGRHPAPPRRPSRSQQPPPTRRPAPPPYPASAPTMPAVQLPGPVNGRGTNPGGVPAIEKVPRHDARADAARPVDLGPVGVDPMPPEAVTTRLRHGRAANQPRVAPRGQRVDINPPHWNQRSRAT